MNIENLINQIKQRQEENTEIISSQYNLGNLIKDLEKLDPKVNIVFENGSYQPLSPIAFGSWRGSYDFLALRGGYKKDGIKVQELLDMAKNTVGKMFEGYKGGEFIMDESTPVYCVEEFRQSDFEKVYKIITVRTSWQVTGVCQKESKVILKTSICKIYGYKDLIIKDICELLEDEDNAVKIVNFKKR